jgi:hypothetical protein
MLSAPASNNADSELEVNGAAGDDPAEAAHRRERHFKCELGLANMLPGPHSDRSWTCACRSL